MMSKKFGRKPESPCEVSPIAGLRRCEKRLKDYKECELETGKERKTTLETCEPK